MYTNFWKTTLNIFSSLIFYILTRITFSAFVNAGSAEAGREGPETVFLLDRREHSDRVQRMRALLYGGSAESSMSTRTGMTSVDDSDRGSKHLSNGILPGKTRGSSYAKPNYPAARQVDKTANASPLAQKLGVAKQRHVTRSKSAESIHSMNSLGDSTDNKSKLCGVGVDASDNESEHRSKTRDQQSSRRSRSAGTDPGKTRAGNMAAKNFVSPFPELA